MGVGAVNLVVGGLLYLVVYLTLIPIVRAVDRQDLENLRTLLGSTRLVARLTNPVLGYVSKLLSAKGQKTREAES